MLSSTIVGFIPFVALFYMIYTKMNEQHLITKQCDKNDTIANQEKLFNTFVVLWSLYGINHLVPNIQIKNIIYNGLDLITKGLFGLYVYKESWLLS